MSLNRSEQTLFDYIRAHAEERQYVQDKVRAISLELLDVHKAVARIDLELWRYFEERSAIVPAFRDGARAQGLQRTSMKNLAEYLVRMWTEPKPRQPAPAGPPDGVEFRP
jgi:hypothetical protein